jgi:glutathione-specific gamma-glutamylcyclotransferase
MTKVHARDVWIFAYGSLMWRPGFPFVEMHRARLNGWHRRFCIVSRYHRGSHDRPGLVLGLDRGGTTDGVVYRVAAHDASCVLKAVRARELISGVYREALLPVTVLGAAAGQVPAIVYLAEKAHPSFNERLPVSQQAHIIARAEGRSGANLDYLVSTVAELARLGIRERELERILVCLGWVKSRRPATAKSVQRHGTLPAGWPRVSRIRIAELTRFLYRARLG